MSLNESPPIRYRQMSTIMRGLCWGEYRHTLDLPKRMRMTTTNTNVTWDEHFMYGNQILKRNQCIEWTMESNTVIDRD